MHRRPVDSSVIAEVGYDRASRVLEVKLTSGAIYRYLGVPARDFLGLLAAPSAGQYYNERIKPHYEFRQV
jgi:KTSC domain-containing protein